MQLTTTTVDADAADRLRAATAQFMQIDDTTSGEGGSYAVRFRGRLVTDSLAAYDLAARSFRDLGYTPLFRKEGNTHVVLAVAGTINPAPSRVWINWAMFGLTVLSVLLTGAMYGYQGDLPASASGWLGFLAAGWPFLMSMLGILLAHELGHYFAARYHKVAVTLPYFIPFPLSPFGTMGAFIQLKAPPTNRRVLLDIGVAGPLAGMVVALPVLFYGLWTSPVTHLPAALPPDGLSLEGNSILYALAKYLVFGRLLPEPTSFGGLPPLLYMARFYALGVPAPLGGLDVLLNDVAWAGWAGLLVTGLNLIPAGQLDGGHALYVLIGRRARLLRPLIVGTLILLGFFWEGWFLWAALIFFLGRTHAEPLDQITELDSGRKWLAIFTLALFVLVITPVPLTLFTR
ncbi:MAG: site-2 protease family protein [Anaerolineales bacterium]|nr:site-2 protease family protein [Anaerolineales bacterium]